MEISCQGVQSKITAGDTFLLLDCREQHEWDYCRIEGATLIPMSELQRRVTEIESHRMADIIVYCHHGVRSMHVALWLQQQGFSHAVSMAGGIEEWSLKIDPNVPRY